MAIKAFEPPRMRKTQKRNLLIKPNITGEWYERGKGNEKPIVHDSCTCQGSRKKKINTVHMAFIVAKSLKEPQWRKGYQE